MFELCKTVCKVFKLRSFGVAGAINVKFCWAGILISSVTNPAANRNRQIAAMPSRTTSKSSSWVDMYGIAHTHDKPVRGSSCASS